MYISILKNKDFFSKISAFYVCETEDFLEKNFFSVDSTSWSCV